MVVAIRGDDAGDFRAVAVAVERRRVVVDHVVRIVDAPAKIGMRHVDAGVDDRDADPAALAVVVCQRGIGVDETALQADVGVVVAAGRVGGPLAVNGIVVQRLREAHPAVRGQRLEQGVPARAGRRLQHDAVQVQGLDRPAGEFAERVALLQRGQGGCRVLAGAVIPGRGIAEQAGAGVYRRRLQRVGDGQDDVAPTVHRGRAGDRHAAEAGVAVRGGRGRHGRARAQGGGGGDKKEEAAVLHGVTATGSASRMPRVVRSCCNACCAVEAELTGATV